MTSSITKAIHSLAIAGRFPDDDALIEALDLIIGRLVPSSSMQVQSTKRDEVLSEGMRIIRIPSPGGAQQTVDASAQVSRMLAMASELFSLLAEDFHRLHTDAKLRLKLAKQYTATLAALEELNCVLGAKA